jgi:hypothetical protein
LKQACQIPERSVRGECKLTESLKVQYSKIIKCPIIWEIHNSI